MSLCVVNSIEMRNPTASKCALKLLGIDNSKFSTEEILEIISDYVEPMNIEAMFYDFFNNFFVLFLADIESACLLVGKDFSIKSHQIHIWPLLDSFVIDNVYPNLGNEDIRDIFKTFGNVFSVTNHYVAPNSSKFSHVLSGKREINFLIPGEEKEIFIPVNVIHPPYSFHVRRFCGACLTEGHSILHCPDIENEEMPLKPQNKSEPDIIVKSESICFTEDCSDATPNYGIKPVKECNVSTPEVEKESQVIQTVTPAVKNHNLIKVNENTSTEVVSSSTTETMEHDFSQISDDDFATEDLVIPTDPIKSSSLTYVSPKHPENSLHSDKPMKTISREAERLIHECFDGLEVDCLKHLLCFDRRNKSDFESYVLNCPLGIAGLQKLLKRLIMECYQNVKYSSLLGTFSRTLHKTTLMLSKLKKKHDS